MQNLRMRNLRNGFCFHADQLVVYKKGEGFAQTAFALVVRVGGDLYLIPENEDRGRYPVNIIENDMTACLEPGETNKILGVYGPREADKISEPDPGIFTPEGRMLWWKREAEELRCEQEEAKAKKAQEDEERRKYEQPFWDEMERRQKEEDAKQRDEEIRANAERPLRFAELIAPVVEFLRSSLCHPHMTIIATCHGAELLEGLNVVHPDWPEPMHQDKAEAGAKAAPDPLDGEEKVAQ